jgi:cell division protein FtsI/penicillin-binding protein 2
MLISHLNFSHLPSISIKNLWFLLVLSFSGAGMQALGQVTVKGTVYNMTRTKPLQAVSVVSTSGRGTITDSNGNYSITVNEEDSISFSYLGRATFKYPVKMINAYNNFDIALHVEPTELKTVHVAPKDYHMDSLQNRKDYARYFDYKKPKFKITDPNSGSPGVGLDLDEIINMFRFNRNRRLAAFQKRLVQDEQDKFVDHRFTRALVKKITRINPAEMDSFMIRFRPSFRFTQTSTDYEFGEYIKLAYKQFKNPRLRAGEMKKEK